MAARKKTTLSRGRRPARKPKTTEEVEHFLDITGSVPATEDDAVWFVDQPEDLRGLRRKQKYTVPPVKESHLTPAERQNPFYRLPFRVQNFLIKERAGRSIRIPNRLPAYDKAQKDHRIADEINQLHASGLSLNRAYVEIKKRRPELANWKREQFIRLRRTLPPTDNLDPDPNRVRERLAKLVEYLAVRDMSPEDFEAWLFGDDSGQRLYDFRTISDI